MNKVVEALKFIEHGDDTAPEYMHWKAKEALPQAEAMAEICEAAINLNKSVTMLQERECKEILNQKITKYQQLQDKP